MAASQIMIEFLERILMPPDDNRRPVDVKQQVLECGVEVPETVFFQGQIDGGIGERIIVNEKHGVWVMSFADRR